MRFPDESRDHCGWGGSTLIFCFSGTGNSLAVAKSLSTKLDSELRWIPSLAGEDRIKVAADQIGLVFPVYHQGIPAIVERFVNKLDDLDGKYVFGVCTCGEGPGITFEYLGRLVESRGGTLAAGFAVKSPYNYVTPSRMFRGFYSSFVLGETTAERQQELLTGAAVKVESIARSFGTCVKVCPVGNIELRDGRPVWHHCCEQCFGCLHWCPNGALQFREGTAHGWRYHHPEIKLSEMILRRDG